MTLLRRHPVAVNLFLSFASAICASLWTNYFTGADDVNPMSDRKHLLIAAALGLLVLQWRFNAQLSNVHKRIVDELLDLGIRFIRSHALKPVAADDIRVIVHLCERASPSREYTQQECLVPRYWKPPIPHPRDGGAIPLELAAYKKWYVNVQAYHNQRLCCAEPNSRDRPDDPKAFVKTPDLFEAKSVISVPIWSRTENPQKVIGTMTFDSTHSLADLDWCAGDVVNSAVRDMLDSLADLIGKVLTNGEIII
jgi:hypothetical protein